MRRREAGDSLDFEFGICFGFGILNLGFQPVFRLWSIVCCLLSVVPHE